MRFDGGALHAILEWHLTTPSKLHIRKQDWHSYDAGNGVHILRHATYYTGTLDYTITSGNGDVAPISGQLEVLNTWEVAPCETDYIVGPNWFTDSYDPADYWHGQAGARTQREVRNTILDDWTERWIWLKNKQYEKTRSHSIFTMGMCADGDRAWVC